MNPARLARSESNSLDAVGGSGRAVPGTSTGVTHELQVGYQDPVLGYVELHAHGDASGIHAALEAQSSAAGETLSAQLGALAGWMHERHTPVESLTVSTLASHHGVSSSADGKEGMTGGDGAGSYFGSSGLGGHGGRNEASGGRPEEPVPAQSSEAVTSALPPHLSPASLTPPAQLGLSIGSSFSVVV